MVITFERNKTSTIVVMYSLYLYFLGLSLRNIKGISNIQRGEEELRVCMELDSGDLVLLKFTKGKEYPPS